MLEHWDGEERRKDAFHGSKYIWRTELFAHFRSERLLKLFFSSRNKWESKLQNSTKCLCFLSSLRLVPLLPQPTHARFCELNLSTLHFFFLSSHFSLLAIIAEHFKQGLQQPVVSVSVRLGAVKTVGVVAVDIVFSALVLVDHIQSLVQGLRREPGGNGWWVVTGLLLLLPPDGRGFGRRLELLLQSWSLPVKGRLQQTQQGYGGRGWRFWFSGLVFGDGKSWALRGSCFWRWQRLRGLLFTRQIWQAWAHKRQASLWNVSDTDNECSL